MLTFVFQQKKIQIETFPFQRSFMAMKTTANTLSIVFVSHSYFCKNIYLPVGQIAF